MKEEICKMPQADKYPTMLLDYEAPSPPTKDVWGLAARICLGFGLTVILCIVICKIADWNLDVASVILAPMWFLDALLNPRVSTEQVIVANSLFYGFIVSFSVGRRWRKQIR